MSFGWSFRKSLFYAGQECLLRNDIFAESYRGNRNISASGQQCLSVCRGSTGIGASCVVNDPVEGRVTQCCHIPYCGTCIHKISVYEINHVQNDGC